MKIAEYLGQQSVDTTFRHYYFDFERVNKEKEVNPHVQRYDSKSVDSKTNLVRHSTTMKESMKVALLDHTNRVSHSCKKPKFVVKNGWWARMDSNHRPQSYQDCTLTS